MRTVKDTDKYLMYLKAFQSAARMYSEDQDIKPFIKKLIIYGVKVVNAKPETETITREESVNDFQYASAIKDLIGTITPGEFVNIFPITKDFDGHKYQSKDYFYTRDYIRSLPVDKTIGESTDVMEFLWEYWNWEITHFIVNAFSYMNNLRRLEGQPSMMEEFCEERGIQTYTIHTDQKGQQFMVDRQTGKSFRVKKKRPRYLKPVS